MNDKELLEFAAKTMGFSNWSYAGGSSGICVELGHCRGAITSYWNPFIDDGDALRLARVQYMTIANEPSRGGWSVGAVVDGEFKWLAHDDDQNRAIVQAAAKIGKAMK